MNITRLQAFLLIFALLCTITRAHADMSLLGVASALPVTQITTAAASSTATSGTATSGTVDDLLTRLGDDPADYGKLVKDHSTGFDTHRDTAYFHNFDSAIGKDGDCAGITYITRRLFLDATWVKEGKNDDTTGTEILEAFRDGAFKPWDSRKHLIHGYASLREASMDPQVTAWLKQAMSYGQIPGNISVSAIELLWKTADWSEDYRRLIGEMDAGKPAPLAFGHMPQLSGHMVLIYRVVEFEKKSVVMIYDSNAGPSDHVDYVDGADDATYKTVMVYDKATKKVEYHKRYHDFLNYDYTQYVVFVHPDAQGLGWDILHAIKAGVSAVESGIKKGWGWLKKHI